MTNQLYQSGSLALDAPTVDTFNRNMRVCAQAMKEGNKKVNPLETALILSIPFSAVLTAILPLVYPSPVTRFYCAALTVASIAAFIVHRLSILQTLPRRHVYMMLGMLGATFLFGLTVALMLSEGVQLFNLL